MRFHSALALGSIATLSTLLLLDLKWDLNNDGVDDNVLHHPRRLRLGRGMDCPLQASTRGGTLTAPSEARITLAVSIRLRFRQGRGNRK